MSVPASCQMCDREQSFSGPRLRAQRARCRAVSGRAPGVEPSTGTNGRPRFSTRRGWRQRADDLDERLPTGRPLLAQRLRRRQRRRPERGTSREERGVRLDPHPGQVQPVGVPARPDRWIVRHPAVRVEPERLDERREARVVQRAARPPSRSSAANAGRPRRRAPGRPPRSRAACRAAGRSRRRATGRRRPSTTRARGPSRSRSASATSPCHVGVASPRARQHGSTSAVSDRASTRSPSHAAPTSAARARCASETSRRSSAIRPIGSPASSP